MVASAPAITAHMGTTLRTSYIPVAGQEDDLYPYLYGAFYERQYIDRKYGIVDGRFIGVNLAFDASRVNTIYGRSNTITPLSRRVTFLIRY